MIYDTPTKAGKKMAPQLSIYKYKSLAISSTESKMIICYTKNKTVIITFYLQLLTKVCIHITQGWKKITGTTTAARGFLL